MAMAMAKQLEAKLRPCHPTFVKPMSKYFTTIKAALMWLPLDFCRKHLPKRDQMISVVDEQDKKFEAKYHGVGRPHFSRFSGFVKGHKVGDGDCLLFQLIEPTVFKVYIIRASSCKETGS